MGQTMPRIVRMLICGVMLALSSPVQAEADDEHSKYDDWCGVPPSPVASEYVIEAKEVSISMPKLGQFVINGRMAYDTLIDGAEVFDVMLKAPWEHEYAGAGVYFYEEKIFVRQFWTDCKEVHSSQIYVFDRKGHLLGSEIALRSNYEDGFYFDGSILTYWNRWFCYEENVEAATMSYVMQFLSSLSAFVRVPRTREENCSPEALEEVRNRRIAFDWFSPDKTLLRDPRLK